MPAKTMLLLCFISLLSCGPNGSLVINDIPLDLAFKTGHCTRAQKACKQARAMENDLEAQHDKSSDTAFELRQEYEALLEECLDLYETCESHEY